MALLTPASPSKRGGVLARLASDTRGNALAIMAMAIFPLAGLVGGGVDMSRLYLSQARLQQACDAGALAGRKVMGGGTWAANSGKANQTALEFFDGNFADRAYGSNSRTRAFSEASGKVTGTASVVVPMTIMKIFGASSQTLTVTCDAEMRLPNTDVMFVLDLSGTMGNTLPGDSQTKIVVLKKAVKCFYESLARLNTNADCGTGNPSGGVGTQTQVRFGFVNYDHNVNVGKLLPPAYFANSWPYQSREAGPMRDQAVTTYASGTPQVISETRTEQSPSGTPSSNSSSYTVTQTTTATSQANCESKMPASATPVATGPESAPSSSNTTTSAANRTTTWQTTQPYKQEYESGALWVSPNTCYIGRRIITYKLVRDYRRVDPGTTTITKVFDKWRYARLTKDIRGLKNGTTWNASFQLPIGDTADGAATVSPKTIAWDGCIEERATIKLTDYSSMSNAEKQQASDLDIDELPNQNDPTTLWGPALPNATYTRQKARGTNGNIIGSENLAESMSAENYINDAPYWCPKESRKLAVWNDPTVFDAYVDSLFTQGRTHHDIGLLWGARFMSPTGIFASENALTPLGGEIARHMIYMTDGETCTHPKDYTSYGPVWYERRETDASVVPTGNSATCLGPDGNLTTQVDKRFEYLCTAVKSKNITLWVVYFGTGGTAVTTRMTNCATDSTKFKPANNAAALQTAFASIANQIAQLRLTQ